MGGKSVSVHKISKKSENIEIELKNFTYTQNSMTIYKKIS